MADALARLAKLRRLERQSAERALAASLQAARQTEAERDQAQDRIATETAAAVAGDHGFSAWLPAAIAQVAEIADRLLKAEQDVAARRHALTSAATAEETVARLAATRAAAERRRAARRAQMALDDHAARRARD